MKRALLIGINYIGTQSMLYGCWNDVLNMHEFLQERGYSDITVMTDSDANRGTPLFPSTTNILSAIQKFVGSAKSGDILFFHFSGHGGQVPDTNRDEIDLRDECIYSCSLEPIIDDTLRGRLVDSLPNGVVLRCLFDCCHSGTGLDLPLLYVPGKGGIPENRKPRPSDSRSVISISGCRDNQTSADAYINSISQGALTAYFLSLKDVLGTLTWSEFVTRLDSVITKSYSQVPQLSVYCEQQLTEIANV